MDWRNEVDTWRAENELNVVGHVLLRGCRFYGRTTAEVVASVAAAWTVVEPTSAEEWWSNGQTRQGRFYAIRWMRVALVLCSGAGSFAALDDSELVTAMRSWLRKQGRDLPRQDIARLIHVAKTKVWIQRWMNEEPLRRLDLLEGHVLWVAQASWNYEKRRKGDAN